MSWSAWTIAECDAAAEIFAQYHAGLTKEGACRLIGQRINRTYWGVRSRFIDYGPTFKGKRRGLSAPRVAPRTAGSTFNIVEARIVVPPEVLADRHRRINLEHATIGAFLCGDPLPGYSALDRK